MQYFGKSGQELIARALRLAQDRGAAELLPEHLLVSARPEAVEQVGLKRLSEQVERALPPVGTSSRPPEFAASTLALFERAYRTAEGEVEELHLLISVELRSLRSEGEGCRVSDLLNAEVLKTLHLRGVNCKLLLSEVGDLDLLAILPPAEYWHTKAGRRIVDLLSASTRPGAGAYSILLMVLLHPGPVSQLLVRSGLSEPMLIEILVDLSASTVGELLASCDFPGLGEETKDWHYAARLALVVGWNCSDRNIVEAQNLLDGLLCADVLCQPGQGATQVLRNLNVLGFAHAATRKMVTQFDSSRRQLKVSDDVRQALQKAQEIAGEAPVGTQHLLYGLAAIGLPELLKNGLSEHNIRRFLSPG